MNVPDGWKLVPIEPTNAMLIAMRESGAEGCKSELARDYALAISAAPAAPVAAPAPSEQDKIDAERYRWIRDAGTLPRVLIDGHWYGTQHRACMDLDAAIDAARTAP